LPTTSPSSIVPLKVPPQPQAQGRKFGTAEQAQQPRIWLGRLVGQAKG
jgi:hypothetical protein